MSKDHMPVQPNNKNDSPQSKQKQLKDEKLAAALRANLRRRKLVSSVLDNAEDKGSTT
jgi:hypothetical protein